MDLSKYAGNVLRQLRESEGMSQEDLARKMGVVKQSVSKYEHGERRFNQDLLFQLSDIFKVSIDEFFPKSDVGKMHTVDNASNNLIPIVGRIAAGEPTYAVEDIIGYMSLPPDQTMKDGLIYLEVTSDSMDRKFPVGSYVLIDTQTDIENGDIAAVKLNGDEATLKKVKFNGRDIMLIPDSHNDDYYPVSVNIEEAEVQMIGKAIGMYLSI